LSYTVAEITLKVSQGQRLD